jgi:uncharacterized protein YjgD (DUF1641 family)
MGAFSKFLRKTLLNMALSYARNHLDEILEYVLKKTTNMDDKLINELVEKFVDALNKNSKIPPEMEDQIKSELFKNLNTASDALIEFIIASIKLIAQYKLLNK